MPLLLSPACSPSSQQLGEAVPIERQQLNTDVEERVCRSIEMSRGTGNHPSDRQLPQVIAQPAENLMDGIWGQVVDEQNVGVTLLTLCSSHSQMTQRVSSCAQLRKLGPAENFAQSGSPVPLQNVCAHERSLGFVELVLQLVEAFEACVPALRSQPLNLA